MDVGQLIRALSHYSPDTPVEVLDGNLLSGEVRHVMYGNTSLIEDIDDGRGGSPTTLYLLTD